MTARDPQGRRRVIIDAALELMAEDGLARLTHRTIAARAGVPLGSTTYYFPTLRDLVHESLVVLRQRNEAQLDSWRQRLLAEKDTVEVIVGWVSEYLENRAQAALEYELYLAAARDELLRAPAATWVPGLHQVLRERLAPEPAEAAGLLIDGAILQSLALGGPPALDSLRLGLSCLPTPRQ